MFRQAQEKGHKAPSFARSSATFTPTGSNIQEKAHGLIAAREMAKSINLTASTARPMIRSAPGN